MKVVLTVAVRNPEWYWSKEEQESRGDYREEWEALNKNIVAKHSQKWSSEIAFDVKDIIENQSAEYEIKFTTEDKSQSLSYTIKDVTIIQFIGGEDQKTEAVVSNSLIHRYIGTTQKDGKSYLYFYLKENCIYEHFKSMIWISEKDSLELQEKLELVDEAD